MDPLLIQTLHNLRDDIQNVESNLRSEILELRKEVSGLTLWKAKVLGGSVVLSTIGSGVITLVFQVMSK